MANEGSTKPTYSELAIAYFEKLKGGKVHDPDIASVSVSDAAVYAQHETLRVRGLLQRQWISVEERLPDTITDFNESDWVLLYYSLGYTLVGYYCTGHAQQVAGWYGRMADGTGSHFVAKPSHWQLIVLPNFPQSSELVPQGAESADIGKLDTADKSGVEMGKVNRVEEKADV